MKRSIVFLLNELFLVVFWALCPISKGSADTTVWRVNEALQLPGWVSLSGQHRTRFETLDGQYRGARAGGDQVFVFRTNILTELNFKQLKFAAEVMDSRATLADISTPLTTSVVNPLELLQAYIDIPVSNLFVTGSSSHLRGGRITMDVGSRRLVARNRFRNTINAFTGVDWEWTGPGKNRLRAFYTFPIQRLVSGNILDNNPKFDREDYKVRFWGVYYAPAKLPWGDKGEIYLFGLNENDLPDRSTRNRELYTLGFRLYRQPAREEFDYQIESVFQIGESRASTTATTDLDHFAHFQHVEFGYSFDAQWSPRLLLQYDYASGDDNRMDSDNDRFDTLFGARRFDFGPTSIYGPFARANISTPGLRLKVKPGANLSTFLALRGFWLASDNDAWTTAQISNPAGFSDNYIATQIEARLRWQLFPKNVRIEAGVAHLFAGDLMDDAGKGDATYLYSQMVFWF
ncbi:MAG: alginate export family protein [Gammaproteobacteria bacterium]